MPHDEHGAAAGHNAMPGKHLHSHPHTDDPSADVQYLAEAFIDGFRRADDKNAFLELAGIPRQIDDGKGRAPLCLVDVELKTQWQVGTASPGFGSRELSYQPFPGAMIEERENLVFKYVSLTESRDVDLREHLMTR